MKAFPSSTVTLSSATCFASSHADSKVQVLTIRQVEAAAFTMSHVLCRANYAACTMPLVLCRVHYVACTMSRALCRKCYARTLYRMCYARTLCRVCYVPAVASRVKQG